MVNDDRLVNWLITNNYEYDVDAEEWRSSDGKSVLEKERELIGIGDIVRPSAKRLEGLRKGFIERDPLPGSHLYELEKAVRKIKEETGQIGSLKELSSITPDQLARESGFDPYARKPVTGKVERIIKDSAEELFGRVKDPVFRTQDLLKDVSKLTPDEVEKIQKSISTTDKQAAKILQSSKVFSKTKETLAKREFGSELSPLEITASLGRRGMTVKNFARQFKLDEGEARNILAAKGFRVEAPTGKTGIERFRLKDEPTTGTSTKKSTRIDINIRG